MSLRKVKNADLSPEFMHDLKKGLKEDKIIGKGNGRLIAMFNDLGHKQAIVDIMLSSKIQQGLRWARDNEALHRCLERLVLKHPKDFADVPEVLEMAKLRLKYIREVA